jgi:hypothetical protein
MTMTTGRRVGTITDLPLTEQERTELRLALETRMSGLRTEIFDADPRRVGRSWRRCSGGWTVGATTMAGQI